jgi:hypothetical protein
MTVVLEKKINKKEFQKILSSIENQNQKKGLIP